MGTQDRCHACDALTAEGKAAHIQHCKDHPLFGTDFSVPLSQTVEGLRRDITRVRNQLVDIRGAFPGWGERTKDVEGLLTCGLIALYNMAEEMREVENRRPAATAATASPKAIQGA